METTYNIQHVHVKEDTFFYEIYFTLNEFTFSFVVYKPHQTSSAFQVQSVFHESGEHCPFCKKIRYQVKCDVLHEDVKSLFQQVISTNTLRLIWLFREYELI